LSMAKDICKNYLDEGKCEIRLFGKVEGRDVKASSQINQAFLKAAKQSKAYKTTLLKPAGCGGEKCCFINNEFATWKDCPFYEI
ncbi:MAG: hypothetical protein PHC38_09120, partial [Weeksellaceae bacterium]|nr:hypothetical protein [Weeksellaceae bacterium]